MPWLFCSLPCARPTLAKPLTAIVPKELPDGDDTAAVRFFLPLNREGTFTAELKATVGPEATLDDVFKKLNGTDIESGGNYRDVRRTRRSVRQHG